jgi:hypothetical protein
MLFIAFLALVDDTKFAGRPFDTYRLHHSLTRFCPVPRLDINVLTPQTFRAVVGVAVSLNASFAMPALKILNISFETHTELATCPVGSFAFLQGCSHTKSSCIL